MANSSILVTILLLTSLHTITVSSSHVHDHDHDQTLKSLHFTLYQHDTINKTDYLIVPSPLGTNITETTSPFGTIGVITDPLTLTKDPTSKLIGHVESIAITSSFDGLDTLSIARIRLHLENGLKGSISLIGVLNATEPSDTAVVGGTADFLFVQGYVTASPVLLRSPSYVYKQEFHLFWPPYASGILRHLRTRET
ncbi:hypothetical protein vseg_016784 [Gypsophila vaccaria]